MRWRTSRGSIRSSAIPRGSSSKSSSSSGEWMAEEFWWRRRNCFQFHGHRKILLFLHLYALWLPIWRPQVIIHVRLSNFSQFSSLAFRTSTLLQLLCCQLVDDIWTADFTSLWWLALLFLFFVKNKWIKEPHAHTEVKFGPTGLSVASPWSHKSTSLFFKAEDDPKKKKGQKVFLKKKNVIIE